MNESNVVWLKKIYESMAADGKLASQNLKTRNRKLDKTDRRTIARRLNDEILETRIKPGKLASEAKLENGTRELDKMRWREGGREDKELLAYSNRYQQVIRALAKLSNQNYSILVDRITVGTSIHPSGVIDELDDIERTQRSLERAATIVDKKLDLFSQFHETLERKLAGFRRGELVDWPYYDLDEFSIPKKTDRSDPDYDEHTTSYWLARVNGETGFSNVAHHRGSPEGFDIQNLGYFPHAYIGVLVDWEMYADKEDLAKIVALREIFASGYKLKPTVDYSDPCTPTVQNCSTESHDYPHCWLILFPSQDMTEVVPALLILDAGLGAIINYVTSSLLVRLQKMEVIGGNSNAYDELTSMIAPEEDIRLDKKWLDSGSSFRHNPFLKKAEQVKAAKERRNKFLESGAGNEN